MVTRSRDFYKSMTGSIVNKYLKIKMITSNWRKSRLFDHTAKRIMTPQNSITISLFHTRSAIESEVRKRASGQDSFGRIDS